MFNTLELGREALTAMIDVSAVQTRSGTEEVEQAASIARKYRCACAFSLPNMAEYLGKLLENSGVKLGSTIGFPSGAETTEIKIASAKKLISLGCDELDMVIAVNLLKSGRPDLVTDEVKRIVDVADGRVLKTIIEVNCLTDDEIKLACECAVRGGSAFVKSGTGWLGPTTVDHIRLMKSAVGNSAKIKAAGGIRTIDTVFQMINAGCERFGIGVKSVMAIIDEYDALCTSE